MASELGMSDSGTSLLSLQPSPLEELFMHSGGCWGHWVIMDHVQDINCGSGSQELWPGALVDIRGEGSPKTKGGLPGLACWGICKSRWQILFGQEGYSQGCHWSKNLGVTFGPSFKEVVANPQLTSDSSRKEIVAHSNLCCAEKANSKFGPEM